MKEKLNSVEQITALATQMGRKIIISELPQYFQNPEITDHGGHSGQGLLVNGKLYRSDNKAFYPNGIKPSNTTSDISITENVSQSQKNQMTFVEENVGKTRISESRFADILRLKKNIILQGAPGTGKTYNTAALALAICGEQIPEDHGEVMRRYEELQKEGRIGFVTFHQSMDYEDFVEGIKPKTENGTVSYEVEDGIFKKICEEGQSHLNRGSHFIKEENRVSVSQVVHNDIDEAINSFLKDIPKEGIYIPSVRNPSKMFLVYKEGGSLYVKGDGRSYPIRMKSVRAGEYDYRHQSYEPAVGQYIRKHYLSITDSPHIVEKTVWNEETRSSENYVLIIDEINRGNVSKIFGELITLLEADKRIGGDHPIRVTLPYSKESFGVPSNLYIIGTMNTTDRSVGNIDYAVRRRFAFATLKADRKLVEQNSIPEAVTLFDAVESFIKKHQIDMDFEDLMVGHSYFFAKGESELELKWQYEILPLLNEYIKDGIVNAKPIKSDMAITDFVGEWHPALAK